MMGAEVTVARQPFVALTGDRRAYARTSAPHPQKKHQTIMLGAFQQSLSELRLCKNCQIFK